MTFREVTPAVLSVQKIFLRVVFFSQAQALKETLVVDLDSLKACLFQRKVEVCRAADILVAVQRVVAVGLIQRRGAFFVGIIHFALVCEKMAEVKGKRMLIAAEMQEGSRLNDSTVKQLCSTDDVFAEKKYKDPFSFKPCHTLVLYTNHLPRVSASDDGIWRRLIVIPFNAKITGKSDIKNYGEYLFDNAGESILAWIIEGARKVIELDYQIPVPACVQNAIDEYRSQNDWFGHFLEMCIRDRLSLLAARQSEEGGKHHGQNEEHGHDHRRAAQCCRCNY